MDGHEYQRKPEFDYAVGVYGSELAGDIENCAVCGKPYLEHVKKEESKIGMDKSELIPPSNPKYPWVPEGWQLLCYYCNQPIRETEPEAGYKQRTMYVHGRWKHADGERGCCLYLIRPESELDKPRCHCCGTQTADHSGYCSMGSIPGYRVMPFSEKEYEVERAARRALEKTKRGQGGKP